MARFRWYGGDEMFSQLERMQREMDRLLSSVRPGLSGLAAAVQRPDVYPPINLYKDENGFIVRAEIPGVDPKAIDLEVTGDTLTLRGERPAPTIPEGSSYHRRERDFGRFRRSLTLPEMVDSSKVTASCNDGVLEIRLPHSEQARPRHVAVKAQ
jgi:HSP20 family protein